MANSVAEIRKVLTGDQESSHIAEMWTRYKDQMRTRIDLWNEQRNYIFATDTTTTTNSSLPWSNTTTLPKLCQIRDNLHSNYLSALFPNDNWMKWEAHSSDAAKISKANVITNYMTNKVRGGKFRKEVSKLLYDYIDYGNAFVTAEFQAQITGEGSEVVSQFIGPKARRISPLDVVFNPLADEFESSWKIIRSIVTLGELKVMAEDMPDNQYLADILEKRKELSKLSKYGGYSIEDWDKASGFQVDGFGNMKEYYESSYVEILEFWGDLHNTATGELERNMVMTVADRSMVLRKTKMPSYLKTAPIHHVGWRLRPDNLWAMGPLENLVGMQYRIDHLENSSADALDLAINPPIVISGEVEEFNYGPNSEIHIDEGGGVTELGKNLGAVITADNDIAGLERRMESFAGAPSEAMGIRTAGEKTAFEVQQLQNAAGRIFQEKITSFETELLEPLLNSMLEVSVRNMQVVDVVRSVDTDTGVVEFQNITKEDLQANGVIRPVGARHFAAQAQLMQNLTQLYSSPIGQMVAPHTSSKKMAEVVENLLGLDRYDLFKANIAIQEQQETQGMVNQAEEDLAVEAEVGLNNEEQLV